MTPLTCMLDDDDARDINAAIAHHQRTRRWPANEGGGHMLPEGDSDTIGAVLGEICRDWLESQGALRQEGDGTTLPP